MIDATALTASPKAVRLLAEQRVVPAGLAALYRVEGDHDTYTVIIGETGGLSCSCPAVAGCSHLEATTLLHDVLVAEGLAGVRSTASPSCQPGDSSGSARRPGGTAPEVAPHGYYPDGAVIESCPGADEAAA